MRQQECDADPHGIDDRPQLVDPYAPVPVPRLNFATLRFHDYFEDV
jgi:hypothetical protein